MPNTYRIDSGRRVALLTRTHRSTGREFAEFLQRVVSDPEFEPGMNVLDDRRDAEEAPETLDIKLAVSQLHVHRNRLNGVRWAVVLAPERPAVLGMYNMFKVFAEELGVDMRIFFTMSEAEQWLGLGRGRGTALQ